MCYYCVCVCMHMSECMCAYMVWFCVSAWCVYAWCVCVHGVYICVVSACAPVHSSRCGSQKLKSGVFLDHEPQGFS